MQPHQKTRFTAVDMEAALAARQAESERFEKLRKHFA
jgi:hypothetical protein